MRPRWKALYDARRQRLDPRIGLPPLPDTFLGWLPALYRVTEKQVLASAGLDAFVFLKFFKMSIKLFSIMFFFAAVVLEPINQHFAKDDDPTGQPDPIKDFWARTDGDMSTESLNLLAGKKDTGYLWSYLVFTYFFTMLTLWVLDSETFKIISVRQEYLGSQSTITDRTFRVSGIPKSLRSEEKIKALVEKLEIGQVESVTLCRNWEELDNMVEERDTLLRKLEQTWSNFFQSQPRHGAESQPEGNGNARSNESSGPIDMVDEEAGEGDRLLSGPPNGQYVERERPQARVWYSFMGMQTRQTDAIDYFEEKLRRLDDKIHAARKKNYEPADLAFVTMDSVAACQMAIQALIDPRPGQLLTKPAPAPSDVVWRNTYRSRFSRQFQGWAVTVFVGFLSIIWLVPVAFLASVLSLCTIGKVFPGLADSLKENEITKAIVQTGLPTAVVSLLNVAIPYLYDYLSYYQGMLSHGDIALSVISKNFFFTFFNIFLVFTVFGTATGIIPVIRESLKDTTYIAQRLASEIQRLSIFYLNFIMLQGIGLFPFRLLEFGSVSLYPFYRMAANTPRDYREIDQPPIFSYGFYLPTALLVFILCLVYSVLKGGFLVLILGVVYFTLGYFTFKYQLLYAMDQPQHATGGAWRMICYRVILGLAVFQLAMSGILVLRLAFTQSAFIIPLLIGTIWYSYSFRRRFDALTRFIALRSIERQGGDEDDDDDGSFVVGLEENVLGAGGRRRRRIRRSSTLDEDREKGLKFVNPSLVVP
jgi:calcium permeable stress-gated cation channel